MRNNDMKLTNKQHGFTLVEVLVAVSVFAIGLMGLAGLQLTAMKNNTSAHARTVATMLAQDIADRARANSSVTYSYDGTGALPSVTAACEQTAGCTQQQMADTDIRRWLDSISTSTDLPNARGVICVDSVPDAVAPAALPNCDGVGNVTVVYIDWTDDKSTTGARNKRFIMSF